MSRRNGRKSADALDVLLHGRVHTDRESLPAGSTCPGCGEGCYYDDRISDYQHTHLTTPDCSEIKRWQP